MALSNDSVVLLLQALKTITQNPDQCFTAFDVTKALRSLTDENIRHRDVRNIIHTFHAQDFLKNYTRVSHTFDVNGDDHTAELYVPPNGDPYSYDPNQVIIDKTNLVSDEVDDEDEDEDGDISDEIDDIITAPKPTSDADLDKWTAGVTGVIASPPIKPPTAAPRRRNVGSPPIMGAAPAPSKSMLDKVKDRLKQKIKFWK